jgi:hypothetical protein
MVEHVFFLLLWRQEHCSVISFTALWSEAITVSPGQTAKENSSKFEVILCFLYPFKKHFNIFLVLNIGL